VRIGLVLGGGGSVGVAYHGAVLAALEEVTGWDARRADVIVGTSAGSVSAAMLRAGVPAADLARISEGLPLSGEGARVAEIGRPHRPRPRPADVLQIRPLADPLGAVHGVAHPWSHSLGAVVAALMPSGGIPTAALSNGIDAVFGGSWPAEPLWLCAVRLRDGRRVVFGQPGGPDARVGQAVAASSAIPGYFQPVTIGGRRYVDGGMRSPTNMDLLVWGGVDLVIVSSPLSQATVQPAMVPHAFLRQTLRAHLHVELAALRQAGMAVVAIEPSRQVAAAMGLNPMDARPRGAVSRVTRANVRRWLEDHHQGRWLVRALAGAGTTPGVATGGERSTTTAGTGRPVRPLRPLAATPPESSGRTPPLDGSLLPSA
jgi:NTE family protein